MKTPPDIIGTLDLNDPLADITAFIMPLDGETWIAERNLDGRLVLQVTRNGVGKYAWGIPQGAVFRLRTDGSLVIHFPSDNDRTLEYMVKKIRRGLDPLA